VDAAPFGGDYGIEQGRVGKQKHAYIEAVASGIDRINDRISGVVGKNYQSV
jgi:hypothetical protein